MARPKSKEPTKDRKISLRVTEANYMKIKSVYGSIQRFFDLMLKVLPVLILVSCGQGGDTVNTGSQNEEGSIVANYRQINYSCDGLICIISDNDYKYTMVFTGTVYYEGNYCIDNICDNYKFSPTLRTLNLN